MSKVIGSMRDVYNGKATHTSGGLTKSNIFFDEKSGTYKSKQKSNAAKGNPWSEAVGEWMRDNPGKLIPKKGTAGYNAIKKIYNQIK